MALTTLALGEESTLQFAAPTTMAVGEEEDPKPTTMAVGEEDNGPSTLRVGEEDGGVLYGAGVVNPFGEF